MLASRYASFYQTLVKSKKTAVRFLARISASDQRTVLGRTLSSLMNSCGLQPEHLSNLTAGLIKRKLSYQIVPEEELWRLDMGQELLKLRDGDYLDLPGFSKDELDELLKHVCVS